MDFSRLLGTPGGSWRSFSDSWGLYDTSVEFMILLGNPRYSWQLLQTLGASQDFLGLPVTLRIPGGLQGTHRDC